MTRAIFNQIEMKPKEYKSEVSPVWCPGCGDYGVLNATYRALSELGIQPKDFVSISGIGCSSRLPYFVQGYKMHTLHGRAGPVATGAQLANPELSVMVAGGDGDGFSIGGGHMPHMARKNVDMVYVLMDNGIYGLTKGQSSPTTRKEMPAYITPYGGVEEPLDPVMYMLTYGATYVAQAFAGNPKMCAELIKGAMEHKGFAYVNIFSQCPSFNKLDTAKWYRGLVEDLPEDYDPTNMDQAIAVARRPNGKAPVGLIYKEDRYTLCDEMKRLVKQVGGSPDYDKQKIVDAHIP